MSDKMLEGFENCSLHDGYGDDRRLEENRTWFVAGWQAAQAVPVVGEVVAYEAFSPSAPYASMLVRRQDVANERACSMREAGHADAIVRELIVKPTHSISAAELERLRKDAERLDWLNKNVTRVSDSERYLPRHVYWGNGTKHNVRTAIDAAIAAAAAIGEGMK